MRILTFSIWTGVFTVMVLCNPLSALNRGSTVFFVPRNAYGAGMGGASLASQSDSLGHSQNPAAAADLDRVTALATASLYNELVYGRVNGAFPLPYGSLGVELMANHAPDQMNVDNHILRYFSLMGAVSYAFSIDAERKRPVYHLGVKMRAVSSSVGVDAGSVFSFDVYSFFTPRWGGADLSPVFALVIKNPVYGRTGDFRPPDEWYGAAGLTADGSLVSLETTAQVGVRNLLQEPERMSLPISLGVEARSLPFKWSARQSIGLMARLGGMCLPRLGTDETMLGYPRFGVGGGGGVDYTRGGEHYLFELGVSSRAPLAYASDIFSGAAEWVYVLSLTYRGKALPARASRAEADRWRSVRPYE